MAKSIEEQFLQAKEQWDLERLYTDLAAVKGKNLSRVEKVHLRGLLCGHGPAEIAEILHKSPRGTEVDLCNTVYRYVKKLLQRDEEERIENWRNVCQWLVEAGYRIQQTIEQLESQLNNSELTKIQVNVSSIHQINISSLTIQNLNEQLKRGGNVIIILQLPPTPSSSASSEEK